MNKPVLAIVIPGYNEEEVLPSTISHLSGLLEEMQKEGLISDRSFLFFVDDGSTDRTWTVIRENAQHNRFVKGIKLSGNRGHQIALMAGIREAFPYSDCLITIDADLQDDTAVIPDMVKACREGYDIVYGVRNDRHTDSFFKRLFAETFYKIRETLGIKTIFNHADFRLMNKRATAALLEYPERNLYLRGLVPLLGFRSKQVFYERKKRVAGTSKYPFRKMTYLAWDGITSFSVVPIKLISFAGFLIFLGSGVMGFYILYIKLFTDQAIRGWASTTLPIYFLGGIQLLALGILGEYIGKIYKEVKRRPLYFIQDKTDVEDEKRIDTN